MEAIGIGWCPSYVPLSGNFPVPCLWLPAAFAPTRPQTPAYPPSIEARMDTLNDNAQLNAALAAAEECKFIIHEFFESENQRLLVYYALDLRWSE
jgi:hypothetical protein